VGGGALCGKTGIREIQPGPLDQTLVEILMMWPDPDNDGWDFKE